MAQEFNISDDMLDFAQKLDTENYNVRSYRKRQTPRRSHPNPKKSQNSEKKLERSVAKTKGTTEVLSSKRFVSTAGVKKRSPYDSNHPSFIHTGRTKLSDAIENRSDFADNKFEKQMLPFSARAIERQVTGRFSKKEKELNKNGPLQNKHFEEWLNQVLLESCGDEKFDETIQNPALKKYGIDKNSLLSKGINPDNLDRIFRALFVYSMGFNNLLKEIGGRHIRKALWKVYVVLLEYCSDGDFETMIGEIERDKLAKMQLLRRQIQHRQQLIDNNEQIHQQKNAKIFKELKNLREQNVNLQNDKTVLMQDFKQAEQAFNEQVSLRLKFQNKINQIHGVHNELSMKHQKLYDDLQIKDIEYHTFKDKLEKMTEKYIENKNDLQFVRKENEGLREENKYTLEQVSVLKQKNIQLQLKDIEANHKSSELVAMIHDRERKIEQAKKQLNNVELMLKLKQDSEQQLQKEYSRSLQENKRLIASLQVQLQQLNGYMVQKKQFNDTHAKIYAELSFVNASVIEKQEIIQKSRGQLKEVKDLLDKNSIELEVTILQNQQLKRDMEDMLLKVDEIKRIKSEFQEETTELRNKEEIYKAYFAEKEKEILKLSEKVEEYERRISQFNITKKTLESRVSLLTQKMTNDEEMYKRKVDRLEIEVQSLDRERKQLREQVEQRRAQSIRLSMSQEQIVARLKDVLFEKSDLQLRYNQSLTVVENQTDHIKMLNIKISQVQERNEQWSRKLKSMQFIFEGKEKTFKMEVDALKLTVSQLQKELKNKKNFIHPMRYEDMLSTVARQEIKLNQMKAKLRKQIADSKQHLLKRKIDELSEEIERCKASLEEQLAIKDKIIDEERAKYAKLQQQFMSFTGQGIEQIKSGGDSFREKQKKYLEFIKEKSGKIEELIKQLEKMHDSSTRMIAEVEELKQQLVKKDEKIAILETQQTVFEKEKRTIQQQKSLLVQEKSRLQTKLEQIEHKRTLQQRQQMLHDPNSRDSKLRQKSGLQSRQQQSREKAQKVEWRNDFTKKVKNAYSYYNK